MVKGNILVSFFIGAALGVSGTFLIMYEDDKEVNLEIVENENENEKAESKEQFVSAVDIYHGYENVVLSNWIDEWNNGDELFEEALIQEIIKGMTHQKIIADEKESSIMITPKRIDTLLQMVEENEDTYEHCDKYLDILRRWRKGDFTIVDADYNVMIQLQGDHSFQGRANGIATEEQEIHYIAQVFGKSVDKVFDSSTLKDFEIEAEKEESVAIEEIDLSWVDDVHAEMLDEWESGDLTFDDYLIQEVMLHMMHQKGEIDEEGSIELTSERTDKLIQIIKEDRIGFNHYENYLDILKRWEKGDFSTIVDDHELLHTLYDGRRI